MLSHFGRVRLCNPIDRSSSVLTVSRMREVDPPGKNTGMCCYFLLQGIFLTQGFKTLNCIQKLRLLAQNVSQAPTLKLLLLYVSWSTWSWGFLIDICQKREIIIVPALMGIYWRRMKIFLHWISDPFQRQVIKKDCWIDVFHRSTWGRGTPRCWTQGGGSMSSFL